MRRASIFLLVFLLLGAVFAAGCIGGGGSATSSPTPAKTATPNSETTTTTSSSSTTTAVTTTTTTATERPYYPLNVTDYLNRTVEIKKEPRRVVTLAPFITGDLYYLGLFDRVVGVTDYDDFPRAVNNVTRIGGYGKYANLEIIASLKPDLIIADTYSQAILDKLEEIAPVVVLRAHTVDDIKGNLILLGKVFNAQNKAEEAVSTFQSQLDEISSAVASEQRVKVFYVVWNNPLQTAGGDSFISTLIHLAGGVNIFNDTNGWPTVSREQVLVRDPQVIILTPHCGMDVEDAYHEFSGTTAARDGRIYMIENENDLIHPSPRLVNGLEILARLLHPDAFAEKYPMTITDFENRTVTIEKEPQRIVSLAPSITETLFYIGAGDKLVGVTQWADWPAPVKNITKVGGYGKYANLEIIASLKPDLIIADDYSLSILDKLEEIAPVVIVAPKSVDGIYRQIELLGKITNREEGARLVIGDMKGEIEYVSSKVSNLTKPKVFFILSYYQGYWTAGKGTFMDSVITLAGGVNVFNDTNGWVKVSEEQVIARDPDVIVVLPTAGINATELCSGPFASTEAVKSGRVYTATDSNAYQRPSPRIVVAIKEMAEFLHPEAFGVSPSTQACQAVSAP
ncbi:vitamin B12 transporter [Thermococcus profundus]|uniref:Vitamin B12 transporter n=1 Tax=Thermococcus profundus TaxID=49899 RepID=A0A2Z2MCF1_THEPR|nr:ABC transporter substrate-binding protein [Thermococcus profundus]ASJ03526.1 vitamin B12 transporter [Thermococcus profundus]